MLSWGQLPANMMDTWKNKRCDVVFTNLRLGQNSISQCNATNSEKKKKKKKKAAKGNSKLPLIAIMAATTSRKMTNPSTKMMSLFNYLLPSLIRSLDCGFRYMFVMGYDKGDKFYDNDEVSTVIRHKSCLYGLCRV